MSRGRRPDEFYVNGVNVIGRTGVMVECGVAYKDKKRNAELRAVLDAGRGIYITSRGERMEIVKVATSDSQDQQASLRSGAGMPLLRGHVTYRLGVYKEQRV